MSRRTAREKAFKMLFAIDIGDNTIEEASEIVMYLMKNESYKLFILSVVRGVLENLSKINELINKYSDDWSVNRMASTDRNILRLAIYEILYCQDIPVSVSINEAVEIAKKYGNEQSYKFINGLLGAIAKDLSFK